MGTRVVLYEGFVVEGVEIGPDAYLEERSTKLAFRVGAKSITSMLACMLDIKAYYEFIQLGNAVEAGADHDEANEAGTRVHKKGEIRRC